MGNPNLVAAAGGMSGAQWERVKCAQKRAIRTQGKAYSGVFMSGARDESGHHEQCGVSACFRRTQLVIQELPVRERQAAVR